MDRLLTSFTAALLIMAPLSLPGAERSALMRRLTERHPDIAGNVWAVEVIDHPTDAQLIAYGRAYFSAEEKMRA